MFYQHNADMQHIDIKSTLRLHWGGQLQTYHRIVTTVSIDWNRDRFSVCDMQMHIHYKSVIQVILQFQYAFCLLTMANILLMRLHILWSTFAKHTAIDLCWQAFVSFCIFEKYNSYYIKVGLKFSHRKCVSCDMVTGKKIWWQNAVP